MRLFNLVSLTIAFAAITAFSSCTKEYTCQCTIVYTGTPGLPDSSVNTYPITDTKKKAQSACAAKSASFQKDDVKTTETCELY